MTKRVSVLVVDDSPICRALIVESLKADPDLEVIGTAENGQEAIEKAAALKPSVITMDVDMPVLDGLSAVERIMAENPTPILVLTADPRHEAPHLTHRALEVGALALQVKPAADAGADAWKLAHEVKLLSTVKVIRHLRATRKSGTKPALPTFSGPTDQALLSSAIGVVVIASSTGGPQVVHKLASELPKEFPAPILLVQHINAAFTDSLSGWLQSSSKLRVKIAADGDPMTPGSLLIAPSNQHLVVASRGKVGLRTAPPRDGHCPSGSTLLESAASVYGRRAVGVILTGMGSDGADGMAAIHAAGGVTIAQNQESCVVYGMPGAAAARGAVKHFVHGDELAGTLMAVARGQLL